MMNYAWDFSPSETEQYFEWIIIITCTFIFFLKELGQRTKHFHLICDHFTNSHDHFLWWCINVVIGENCWFFFCRSLSKGSCSWDQESSLNQGYLTLLRLLRMELIVLQHAFRQWYYVQTSRYSAALLSCSIRLLPLDVHGWSAEQYWFCSYCNGRMFTRKETRCILSYI